MALEALREEIFKQTAVLKFPNSKYVSRVFYTIISPDMSYLKGWFGQWFPMLDSDLEMIHPWIIFDTSADMSEEISQAWLKAFGAQVANNLTNKGYRMIDNANQIILVGDLTEENFFEKLNTIHDLFNKSVPGSLRTPTMPLYLTGLFLIRSIENVDGKSRIRNVSDFDRISEWAKNNLHRIFLVDISNKFGTAASETRDLHFLLGQLLYILTRKPIEYSEKGDPSGYGQWMMRNIISDGYCSGFSGVSVLMPIDQIMEMSMVIKGGDLLKEAFLKEPLEERINLYYLSILNKTGLNSYETAGNILRSHKKYKLFDPFSETNKSSIWDIDNPEIFINYMDTLDAKLPGYAEKNKELMNEAGKWLLEDFKYNLLEHVNGAISSEKGGIKIAKKFLKDLKEHIEKIIPEDLPDKPVYTDPADSIQKLKTQTEIGPKKEALAARTFIFGGATFLGTYGIWGSFDFPLFFAPIGVSLIPIGSGFLYWYSWKSRTERLVVKIQETLLEKWNMLMKERTDQVLCGLRSNFLSVINDISSRVDNVLKRLEELFDFFRENHTVPEPLSSAFWMYALNSSEYKNYSDLIDVDIPTIASEYLLKEQPLKLWERVSPVGSLTPNPWEWELLEKAAFKLVPHCKKILDLSVCKIIRDCPQKADNFAELYRRSANPFFNIKAGQPQGDIVGIFEISAQGCDDVYDKLKNAISGDISNIEKTDSMTKYRISFFSFMEGVNINSVNRGT